MKKMIYGAISCEVTAAENCTYNCHIPCDYHKETVIYAAEHFFLRCEKTLRECTHESWRLRIAKGKKKHSKFTYVVPAVLMELPGNWVRISCDIDAVGDTIRKIELLREHPCFME